MKFCHRYAYQEFSAMQIISPRTRPFKFQLKNDVPHILREILIASCSRNKYERPSLDNILSVLHEVQQMNYFQRVRNSGAAIQQPPSLFSTPLVESKHRSIKKKNGKQVQGGIYDRPVKETTTKTVEELNAELSEDMYASTPTSRPTFCTLKTNTFPVRRS
ncbi:hypothetical protein RCL1_009127 [Eukaryota sp. TZLM3-RCL]